MLTLGKRAIGESCGSFRFQLLRVAFGVEALSVGLTAGAILVQGKNTMSTRPPPATTSHLGFSFSGVCTQFQVIMLRHSSYCALAHWGRAGRDWSDGWTSTEYSGRFSKDSR